MIIPVSDKQHVTQPNDVYEILKAILEAESPADQDKEHFWVFYLTSRQQIKSLELVSLGTLDSSLVHPREVFTNAIAIRCSSILVAHNHPSGITEPSSEDIELTRRLVDAGEILGIPVTDHIILSTKGYTSLKQEGMIL